MPPKNLFNTPLVPPPQTELGLTASHEMIEKAERWDRLTEESKDGILISSENTKEEDPNFTVGIAVEVGYPPEHKKRMEDRVLARPDLGLYCVLDGVGGVPAGDVAATIAGTRIDELFTIAKRSGMDFFGKDGNSFPAFLKVVQKDIHRCLVEYQTTWHLDTTPKTCVAFVLMKPTVESRGIQKCLVIHIGDCRVSQFQPYGEFFDLTQDHNLLSPHLSEVTVQRHEENMFVTRMLGGDEEDSFESQAHDLPPGAGLLLTTDGIHDVITATERERYFFGNYHDKTLQDLTDVPLKAEDLAQSIVRAVNTLNEIRKDIDKKRTKVDNRAVIVLKPRKT